MPVWADHCSGNTPNNHHSHGKVYFAISLRKASSAN